MKYYNITDKAMSFNIIIGHIEDSKVLCINEKVSRFYKHKFIYINNSYISINNMTYKSQNGLLYYFLRDSIKYLHIAETFKYNNKKLLCIYPCRLYLKYCDKYILAYIYINLKDYSVHMYNIFSNKEFVNINGIQYNKKNICEYNIIDFNNFSNISENEISQNKDSSYMKYTPSVDDENIKHKKSNIYTKL